MTLSPKKYVSNFTSTTTNRGVEAKELEIAHTRLDMESSGSVRGAARAGDEPRASDHDETGSYIQVVVHKQARRCSSPLAAGRAGAGAGGGAGGGDTNVEESTAAGAALQEAPHGHAPKRESSTSWKKFASDEHEPARVKVYRLDGGGEAARWVSAWGAARRTRVEAAARAPGRRLGAALEEALGAAGLVAWAPLGALVAAERHALRVARRAAAGAVRAAADEALKPALALALGAVLGPALACVGRAAAALREALRPLWGALGDALEPAVRLLAAARLVDVHLHLAPSHPHPHPHPQPHRPTTTPHIL